jgi:hypothetical protein
MQTIAQVDIVTANRNSILFCKMAVFKGGRNCLPQNKKSPGDTPGLFLRIVVISESDSGYVRSLKAFRALDKVKSYPVSFGEGFEAVARNGRKVNKYVITVLLLEKTKTLAVIEPFYCTICHLLTSPDVSSLILLRNFAARLVYNSLHVQSQ